MTITRVQGNEVNSTSSTTSQAITLGSGITQGNLVVAAVASGSNTTTITGPSGWTQAVINQPAGSNATIETSIWYLVVGSGQAGQTSWTFTFSASHTVYLCIEEWSSTSGWQGSPLDVTATGDTSGSPTQATTIVSGTTSTTAQASELWIASLAYKGSAQTESSVSSGWTSDLEATLASNNTMTMLYKVASSTGAAACQYSIGSAAYWAGCVATFKPVVVTTSSRTVPASAALLSTNPRTVPASAALMASGISRTVPATASLAYNSLFYASSVASTAGGLTLSDQMSMTIGGTETSVAVTMPSSGTNTYVELLSQGGASNATSSLPAPTGNGWSLSLAGSTILAGSWFSTFTLAKSGTSMSGASLFVRWYRRTMDGTCYYIGSGALTSQTFSTKAVYSTPSATATLWQFIAGDVLYMDAFVWNGAAAWSSDVFTVYVSNSATRGVVNDGMITTPQMITTPAELACYIGTTSLQTGTTLPVLNQSFTLADAIDQRDILTLTGEDANGTFSYQRAMPVYFGDHDQGKLYDGYVNSDKISKPAAGGAAQLEHALTFMDHHYDADKRANVTNYLNWSAGDMVCDFIQQTLSQENIAGAFALESDYTPTTFGQGTLSGTVATTTTSPFTYAPNTATPPVTSNTGDLELTRAGTQFMLTETVTSDFSSGTLTNMVASNNELSPSTQSAIKVTASYSPVATTQSVPAQESAGAETDQEQVINLVYVQVWSGSQTVGTNDTLNYDLWIASTSPAYMSGVDLLFSDGSHMTDNTGFLDTNNSIGLVDQNSASVDLLQDLSAYAKDTWYTRNITLTGLNGKTVTGVYVYLAGSSSGDYTVFVKNCYLGSHSGSPFFSTTATATQLNPPTITAIGGYLASTIITQVLQVYNPLASYRVSGAHSISGVGLVQNSSITWTASLPVSGTAQITYPPGTQAASSSSTSGAGTMIMLVSYDGNTWLQCTNSQALPGLPPGANVSGLSLYLREQFAAGSDPTAIPALLNVQITLNSAANQTVSDIVTAYGTSTQWNTGTLVLTNPNSNGNLTLGGSANPLTQSWSSSAILNNQTFLAGAANSGTQAVSGGAYTMTPGAQPTGGSWCQSRFDWAGYFQDGTIEADLKIGTNGEQCGIEYRQTGWGNANNNMAYFVGIDHLGSLVTFGFGSNSASNTVGTFYTLINASETINLNTTYHLKIVVSGNRHTIYFNHSGTAAIDMLDSTYTGAGQIGFRAYTSTTSAFTATIDNFSMVTTTAGTWTSPATSLTSLGTCGYSQVCWTDLDSQGQVETTTTVLASTDGGSTWMPCTNGAEIPQLARGTSTSGMSLVFQMLLFSATPPISTPVIYGLYARVCGNYGTVSGTRISPALNLSPVGYVASSNCMWNANIPTSTSLTVQTTQDLSTFHTVGSNGAGEALPYWTNQPAATQDLFSSNTSANYTSTAITGGSTAYAVRVFGGAIPLAGGGAGTSATVTYNTATSSLTLVGGSGALYLNNAILTSDVDLLCDMGESDAGGLAWREVDTSDYYELGVYDASSSSGFTNQLRLYKVVSGTRSLLGSASSITFTRGTIHRVKVTMKSGLINVYWDGTCMQSYLDTSPLGAGACGLRNDGGASRYYQLWIQPLGTNLTGQTLYTKVTMTTSDPSVMPQLFTLVCCIRGPSIGTGATISQLHPITTPFAAYYSSEIDTLVQASGDYYWYIDKWRQLHFGPRLARPGAFPVQSIVDPANSSGFLLYLPQVTVLSSADLFRSQQAVTNVTGTVTPPPEVKVADGSTTSWTLGYPVYSAPVITINGQSATVGLQGIDNNRQFYWQPGSASISYDSSLPKLPAGTILTITYVGESTVNVILNNSASQAAQAALEGNSGIVAEIESALNSTTQGMTAAQATTFGNGLLSRYGNNATIELVGTTRYPGLAPGTVIPVFLQEMMSTWNAQLPIVKVTTTAYQGANGLIYLYSIDATTGPNLSNWARLWY